jgi:hypothetical protein
MGTHGEIIEIVPNCVTVMGLSSNGSGSGTLLPK